MYEDEEGSAAVDVYSRNPLKQVMSNGSVISGADSAIGGVGFGTGSRLGGGPGVGTDAGFSVGHDTGTGMEMDMEMAMQEGEDELEHIYLDLDDDHEGSTLIASSDQGVMQGIKQMDLEITDNEVSDSDADADVDASPPPHDHLAHSAGRGLKRKRTIRLIIRSRAFL